MTKTKKNYWNQQELADRYGVSKGTISKWTKDGHLPFLRYPGSTRILYPIDDVISAEAKHTIQPKEVEDRVLRAKPMRKKPVVSTTPQTKWKEDMIWQ